MKKLFALLALLPAMASAQCNVYFSIRDFGLDPLSSNTVRMIATNSTPAVSSTNVIANDWKQYRTSTNGFVTFTNCRAYAYHVLISGPNSTTTFKIQGMPTDGSTVNGADYIVPVVSPSITSYLTAGTNIYLKTNSGVLSINFSGTNALLTNVTLHATSNASPVNALGQTSDGKVVKIAVSSGSGDAGGTNSRQGGSLALTNLSNTASNNVDYVTALTALTNGLNTASNLLSATKLGKTNDTATALTVRGAVGATVPTFVVGNSNLTATNFVVATNGNVAVGTNSPSHKLSVAGNFGAAPNEGTYQFVVASDTGALNIGEGEAELRPGQMILKYSGPLGIQVINNDLDASEPQFRVSPGASLTVVSNNGPYHSGTVTPSRVALWDAARGLTNSANVDATELGYLDGVTSAIQTQLDGKAGNGVTNSFVKTQDTRGHTNSGKMAFTGLASNAAPVNTLGQLANGEVVQIANGTAGQLAAVTLFATNLVDNFTIAGPDNIQTNSTLLAPTNGLAGVMVAQPGSGNSNQWVMVPLTAGQYVTYNGTAYTASNVPSGGSGTTYGSITLGDHTTANSPSDSLTYFIGPDGGYSVSERRDFTNAAVRVPFNCTIVGFYIHVSVRTATGSSEAVTNFVWLNGVKQTSGAVSNEMTYQSLTQDALKTGLSISASQGDQISIGADAPGWVTNPTGVRWHGRIDYRIP